MRFTLTDWGKKLYGKHRRSKDWPGKASIDIEASNVLVNFNFTLKDLHKLRETIDDAITALNLNVKLEEEAKKA